MLFINLILLLLLLLFDVVVVAVVLVVVIVVVVLVAVVVILPMGILFLLCYGISYEVKSATARCPSKSLRERNWRCDNVTICINIPTSSEYCVDAVLQQVLCKKWKKKHVFQVATFSDSVSSMFFQSWNSQSPLGSEAIQAIPTCCSGIQRQSQRVGAMAASWHRDDDQKRLKFVSFWNFEQVKMAERTSMPLSDIYQRNRINRPL